MPDRELKAFPPSWVVAPLYVEARQPITGRSVAAVTFLQLLGVTQDHDHGWRERLAPV